MRDAFEKTVTWKPGFGKEITELSEPCVPGGVWDKIRFLCFL